MYIKLHLHRRPSLFITTSLSISDIIKNIIYCSILIIYCDILIFFCLCWSGRHFYFLLSQDLFLICVGTAICLMEMCICDLLWSFYALCHNILEMFTVFHLVYQEVRQISLLLLWLFSWFMFNHNDFDFHYVDRTCTCIHTLKIISLELYRNSQREI